MATSDDGLTEGAISNMPHLSAQAFASPSDRKFHLQLLLDNKEKQLQQAGTLGQRVLAQQIELEEKIRQLQELDAERVGDEELDTDARERYRELAETITAWDVENAQLSNSFGQKRPPTQHTSPALPINDLPREEPERLNASASFSGQLRRAKNAAHRADDVEFAFEIGSGLLTEVRRLQSTLGERDEAIQDMKDSKGDLEKTVESLRIALRSQEQSSNKLKEENWNLEVTLQEFRTQLSDSQSTVERLESEHKHLTKLLNNAREAADHHKNEAQRVQATFDDMKAKHETDVAQARKHAAGLQRDKSDLQSALDVMKVQAEKASRRLNSRFGSPLAPGTSQDKEYLTPVDVSPNPSPSRPFHASNHPNNDIDALQQRLTHAQRQISTLKGSLLRQKEMEYRRKLGSLPGYVHDENDPPEELNEDEEVESKHPHRLTPFRPSGCRRGRGEFSLIDRLGLATHSSLLSDYNASPPPPVPPLPSSTGDVLSDEDTTISYANRSLLMAKNGDWDNALHDALRSVDIQPSLTGYLSQGIVLCGLKHFWDAMKAFDLAFMYADEDSITIHLLLLIKAIALFNAGRHQEAVSRVQELAISCPNADTLACRVVEAYLRIQLGTNALDDASHSEAADHFTAAINGGSLSSEHAIHLKYEVFVVLFGWDLKSVWQTANQKRCHALLLAGRLSEAHEAYRYMMDISDEAPIVCCHDCSIAFKQESPALYINNGDAALSAKDYDNAIKLYSAAIDHNFVSDTVFASRCTAKLGKMLWEDALLDAQKVIELNPTSYLGYKLKNAALHGAERYDEAIEACEIMLLKLNDTPNMQLRMYISPSEAHVIIRKVIDTEIKNSPPRLINTSTGRLCDREAQINAFKTTIEYKKLLSGIMKDANLQTENIREVVMTFFQYVMLSHRWEGKEPLLHDVQDRSVYELDAADGTAKLQSFCKVVRDAGYHWAWSDTCCINKNNNIELQQSVNTMFVWYRHSTLTIVYLSDVLPSSKAGALAMSIWNSRGWTVQEFLAPKVVLFYQNDWTLYLNDHSPNHKESAAIMRELEDVTGISGRALVAFRPGMKGAREKLQWSSMRVTTLQEDIAYSLFGIFGIHLSPIYGENKQNALGRLLREIIALSGDITCLDWVGESSEFNSCLPADITVYGAPPSALPSPLSEDEMQTSVSLLRDVVDVELASTLCKTLHSLSAPQFVSRRLRLPCIAFAVTAVRRRRGEDQSRSTFGLKADGLHDLLITTEDKLVHLFRARSSLQSFLLVRPWDRSLLELPDLADLPELSDSESEEDWSPPVSPLDDSPDESVGGDGQVGSKTHLRALRLIVRLGRPFGAFLLAQQWGGEYKRIASDHNIIVQVKDMTAVHDMDVRTLEIL